MSNIKRDRPGFLPVGVGECSSVAGGEEREREEDGSLWWKASSPGPGPEGGEVAVTSEAVDIINTQLRRSIPLTSAQHYIDVHIL